MERVSMKPAVKNTALIVGRTVAVAMLFGVALAGCSTVKGWFGCKNAADKPL
jgi:hypothetical protein